VLKPVKIKFQERLLGESGMQENLSAAGAPPPDHVGAAYRLAAPSPRTPPSLSAFWASPLTPQLSFDISHLAKP